ncbi:peroxisomal N(1)-acetyl-spermine/spermidine oxidase-like isoform X1 [Lingula anatina]|uniref:Peroxisomal N(1)-acetyl-spermine/spermidine oxidase-like isoform X1 n=2 Tax=Lingula anatina TaxID=7574 RepID=A0A1S3J3D1_LINAN|nr:peroxisomal N(1)-acetyl-spermine/spermidine oxidase-like isoform X1 [Lingula anatina]XP_013404776.1 peroxisomal N(1)-acetyl-spermine/spermidine oxidase-like isoform X1 [Lingula anatina]|eukprot:XP_013404775.1 peroxisomal N(1)-acetyl-spermine/spermidine oxidase-like isoform X1 [Lingula anatina]
MSSDKTSDKFYGVVIIGAGIAGLSVAETFTAAGFEDFIILEASDRIGGRCHTEDFGGSFVELGANWIHGTTSENSIMVLAEENDLANKQELMNWSKGCFYRSDGRKIDEDLGAKVWDFCMEIDAEAQRMHCCLGKQDKTIHTVEDFYVDRLPEFLEKFSMSDRDDATAIFNSFFNYQRLNFGWDIAKVPFESYIKYKDIDGGDAFMPKGARSLISAIASRFRSKERIKVGAEVVTVNWEDGGVKIRCSSGDTYRAKCAVVTVSLGFLKKHHQTFFDPPLSHEKYLAIDRIAFGVVNKIFLEYDPPFWSKDTPLDSVRLAWDNKELVITDPKSQWFKRIFCIDAVRFNSNCLCVWISCHEGLHVETVPDEEISETCTMVLRQFLGDPTIPYPCKVIRSTWGTNKYTLGSYSCMGLRSNANHFNVLAEPIEDSNGQPRVLFAGEATHAAYNGTMHGARESGVREATRLLRQFGMLPSPREQVIALSETQ